MPGAREEFPFGEGVPVFKVGGRIFAISKLGGARLEVSVKCDPETAQRLRVAHPAEVRPGYHLNKRHWNTVTCNAGLDDDAIFAMIEDSYDLVVEKLPKALGTSLRQRRRPLKVP